MPPKKGKRPRDADAVLTDGPDAPSIRVDATALPQDATHARSDPAPHESQFWSLNADDDAFRCPTKHPIRVAATSASDAGAAASSARGLHVAACSGDQTVARREPTFVSAVALSPNSRWLAVAFAGAATQFPFVNVAAATHERFAAGDPQNAALRTEPLGWHASVCGSPSAASAAAGIRFFDVAEFKEASLVNSSDATRAASADAAKAASLLPQAIRSVPPLPGLVLPLHFGLGTGGDSATTAVASVVYSLVWDRLECIVATIPAAALFVLALVNRDGNPGINLRCFSVRFPGAAIPTACVLCADFDKLAFQTSATRDTHVEAAGGQCNQNATRVKTEGHGDDLVPAASTATAEARLVDSNGLVFAFGTIDDGILVVRIVDSGDAPTRLAAPVITVIAAVPSRGHFPIARLAAWSDETALDNPTKPSTFPVAPDRGVLCLPRFLVAATSFLPLRPLLWDLANPGSPPFVGTPVTQASPWITAIGPSRFLSSDDRGALVFGPNMSSEPAMSFRCAAHLVNVLRAPPTSRTTLSGGVPSSVVVAATIDGEVVVMQRCSGGDALQVVSRMAVPRTEAEGLAESSLPAMARPHPSDAPVALATRWVPSATCVSAHMPSARDVSGSSGDATAATTRVARVATVARLAVVHHARRITVWDVAVA